jgi:hypothetical protein
MSIQFGAIHNLVRTYQRVLDLDPHEPAPRSADASADADVHVTISPRARELAQALDRPGRDSGGAPEKFDRSPRH